MDKDILRAVTTSALFHDIGKFAERAGAVQRGDRDLVAQEYRYAHAHHTELAMKALFPTGQLEREFANDPEVNILNMAARHHKPRNLYEKIVSQADRIASGHERSGGDDFSIYETGGRERKRQTPLLSILSRIQLHGEQSGSEDWRYKINKAGTAVEAGNYNLFFPMPKEQYTYGQVEQDYVQQWNNFKEAIKPISGNSLDLFDQIPMIIAICREFQWCLPASTRKEELPDVSLFDHQKVTAALASCLYCYHAAGNTLNEASLADRSTCKFLLYCGDISGIQKFIYGISSKGAYRTLKGKSFYIQLLAEILASETIEHFSLTEANVLYASGGKFYLLLPNLPNAEQTLDQIQDSINQELLDQYKGILYLRTGCRALSADDLTRDSGTTLYRIWEQLTRQLVYQDRQRYSRTASENYDFLFAVRPGYNLGSCEVCHRTMKDRKKTVCSVCRSMEELGRQLGNAQWIGVGTKESDLQGQGRPIIKIRNRFIWLLQEKPSEVNGENLKLMGINSQDYYQAQQNIRCRVPLNCVPFTIGSSHRFDTTFDKIAERAAGNFKRLGILRMDVDNLGRIFSEGLENYHHTRFRDTTRFHSLGRITTMSWQLSQFFGAVLPAMIAAEPGWCEKVTVVYSGGDDLFLLGAWDVLPDVALEIRKQFAAFSCHNSSFSLSGGMVITGGSFPIYKSAEMAGDAETKAKNNTTVLVGTREKRQKNSFTFFDKPMHWREFSTLADIHLKLMKILNKKENYSFLHRLRDIALSWQESAEKLKRSEEKISLDEIHMRLQAEKWRWRMVYALSRYLENKDERVKNDIGEIMAFIVKNVAGTERTGIELLGVLARWSELKIRK